MVEWCMVGVKDAEAQVIRNPPSDATLPATSASVGKKIGRPRLNRTVEEKRALRREYLRKYRARKRESD